MILYLCDVWYCSNWKIVWYTVRSQPRLPNESGDYLLGKRAKNNLVITSAW